MKLPAPADRERWRRAVAALDEVMEVPGAERAAALDVACAGDEALRALMESLLAAEERAGGFLATTASERAGLLLESALEDEPSEGLFPGGRLGPYELVRRLGEGGMGVVWEARDLRLGRPVAVKLFPAGWGSAAAERFVREARAASALDHPNICTVYDIGQRAGGQLYLVMACYDGETLAEKLVRGPLPLATALDLAGQLGRGLEAAHAAGIVHRDVKPANVIVTGQGVAKILDFGIAKIAGAAVLTRTGAALGTPAYMSPEQVSGQAVDGRSDLWSLAVMLYEMVAGRRPFGGDSAQAVFRTICQGDPEPLGVREVPPRLERSLRRALAKAPADRFPSVAAFASELARVQEEAGSPVRRSRITPGGLRRAAMAAALTVLAGLAVDPASGPPVSRGAVPEGPLSLYAAYQEGRAYLRHGYRRGHPERAVALFQEVLRQDDRNAPALAGLGEAFVWLYARQEDPLLLDRALESAELAVSLDGQLARARLSLGSVLLAKRRAREAVRQLEEAVRLDPLSADAHRELGNALAALRRRPEAVREYRRAVELAPDDWLAQERLALLAYSRGDYPAAEAAFLRALARTQDNAGLHDNLSAVYYRQGRFAEAAAQVQRSLEIEPLGRTYTNLGTLQFFLGRYRAALVCFERAIELGANRYLNWANLGDAYRWTGQAGEAREAYLRALQLLAPEIAAAPGDPTLRSRRALYLAKRGDTAEGLREIAALEPLPDGNADLAYRYLVVCEIAGERERALAGLVVVLGASGPLEEIRRDPELSGLRQDPRYHRLMSRAAGLPGGSGGGGGGSGG